MSERYGPHWFTETVHFGRSFRHADFITRVNRDIGHDNARAAARQTFIKHYYDKYGEPSLPPSWMVFETLSFGTVSQVFKNLTRQNQKPIANTLGIDGTVVGSWLHALSYLRNLGAQHQRLWNRVYTIKPIAARHLASDLQDTTRFYAQAVIIEALLRIVSPGNRWGGRLAGLIAEHSSVSLDSLP